MYMLCFHFYCLQQQKCKCRRLWQPFINAAVIRSHCRTSFTVLEKKKLLGFFKVTQEGFFHDKISDSISFEGIFDDSRKGCLAFMVSPHSYRSPISAVSCDNWISISGTMSHINSNKSSSQTQEVTKRIKTAMMEKKMETGRHFHRRGDPLSLQLQKFLCATL